ncbi:hypothetical protein SAMN04488509_106102 [Aquimonas voraii]|uniref:Uncharacterized protein n=1 Tax=Aquimonas voraii TaxID=265719 RepID=A0A1G6X8R5_9GAMM|nr:hypothetical protein SAMN04488509_106102 [Aquimonas voraii]
MKALLKNETARIGGGLSLPQATPVPLPYPCELPWTPPAPGPIHAPWHPLPPQQQH